MREWQLLHTRGLHHTFALGLEKKLLEVDIPAYPFPDGDVLVCARNGSLDMVQAAQIKSAYFFRNGIIRGDPDES